MTSASKWMVLGGLLTTLNLAWFLATGLEAAPSDVKGSGNMAVASYTTTKGTYILWSSGRITEAESGKDVAPPYGPAPGFAKAPAEKGAPAGSPRVAVDYIQNSEGTYTLFADGSVQKADDEGASSPAVGVADIKIGVSMPNSLPPLEHGIDMPDTRTVQPLFSLKEPFKEGGIALMPLKSAGVPDPTKDGLIGAFSFGPDEKASSKAVGGGVGNNMVWDGTWVIAIGK